MPDEADIMLPVPPPIGATAVPMTPAYGAPAMPEPLVLEKVCMEETAAETICPPGIMPATAPTPAPTAPAALFRPFCSRAPKPVFGVCRAVVRFVERRVVGPIMLSIFAIASSRRCAAASEKVRDPRCSGCSLTDYRPWGPAVA
jgi:hypothetical protein